VNEKAISFGPEGVLAGVLTEPDQASWRAGAPAVLMWNVGLNHHVGPWRFNVELARMLGKRGVPSLRFDVSGLGDSETRRDTRSDHERALADVTDAIGYLEKRKIARSVILVGFCSSVDAAHVLAARDPRVAGVVYLEGYAFRTRGFWMRYPLRLVDRPRVKRFLKNALPRVFGDEVSGTGWGQRAAVFAREYPSTEQLRRDFASMVAEKKRLLFVYVGVDTNYNHRDQFFEMYLDQGPRDGIDVDYFGDMDHTFFRVEDRQRVLERVASWVEASIPERAESLRTRAY
jgi:hypothetical protein